MYDWYYKDGERHGISGGGARAGPRYSGTGACSDVYHHDFVFDPDIVGVDRGFLARQLRPVLAGP